MLRGLPVGELRSQPSVDVRAPIEDAPANLQPAWTAPRGWPWGRVRPAGLFVANGTVSVQKTLNVFETFTIDAFVIMLILLHKIG